MSGPAPKEIQGLPVVKEKKQPAKILQFIPHEEATWSNNIGETAREADTSFKPGDEIPPTAQTIPNKTSTHIQPGVNAEPFVDQEDIMDITRRTAGHVVNLVNRKEGLSAHGEATSGSNVFKVVRAKIRTIKENLKNAA